MESQESLQVLLKSWETFQALIKSQGEIAWKVRIWGVSVWSALLAYSFKETLPHIVLVAVIEIAVVFLVELAVRQIQYKYIDKSIEIEHVLNSLLVGDEMQLPSRGISTNIDTPNLADLVDLLRLKRWLVWLPYLLLLLFSATAWKIVS